MNISFQEVLPMGKRFLISLLLILVVVGCIVLGSAMIFSNRYDALVAEQDTESVEEPEDLTALAGQVVKTEDSTQETTDVPVPQASATQTVTSDASTAQAKVLLQSMTLEEKLCQMLFVTPEALTGYTRVTQSGDATKEALEQWPVGGIIYFSTNLVTVDQTTEMLANIQSFSQELTGRGLFLGVDEEGGSVARVADSLGTTSFDDMSVYGAAGDTEAVYNIGATQASELTALGFNVNFSPVADVLTNEENTVVQDRSFGSDPDLVSSMVTQVVKGLTDGGMLCAPKHFPGHGSTGTDTHDGYASSDRTLTDLENCDLKPFEAAIEAGAPMIMVGHMTMTEIDPDNPASLSSTIVTGILRDQLGYDGIIITDALNMSAITDHYTNAEAAVQAVSAGCDMLLCVSNVSSVVNALTEAVENGTIAESSIDDSVIRILAAKYKYGIIS
jgi:beta-N-acetylhexosaminidase